MVTVIFICAIMPMFWLLVALNSHTPEKSAGAPAKAGRAACKTKIPSHCSFMCLSLFQAPRCYPKVGCGLGNKQSVKLAPRYRVKKIFAAPLVGSISSWNGLHRQRGTVLMKPRTLKLQE